MDWRAVAGCVSSTERTLGTFSGYGYGYGYENCRGHPGAPPIRYNAYSTLSGSTVGRCVLVRLCHSLPRAPPVRRAAACLES